MPNALTIPTSADLGRIAAAEGAAPTAWNDPDIQARWRRFVRNTAILSTAIVVGALLLSLAFAAYDRRDTRLLEHGVRTVGEVTATEYGGRRTSDHVVVEYRIKGADPLVVRRKLVGPGPDDYQVGDRITIYYDPDWPSRFRSKDWENRNRFLDGALFMSVLALAPGFAFAAVRWWRALRWRAWLLQGPLRPLRVRKTRTVRRRPWGEAVIVRVQGDTESGERIDTLLRVPTLYLTEPEISKKHGVLVCMGPARELILFDRTTHRPWPARMPRSAKQLDRWWAAAIAE